MTKKKARFLCLFVVCESLFSNAWAQEQQLVIKQPSISVEGEAVVQVTPDRIKISLGVDTWDKKLAVAKSKNDISIKKAIAAIREMGVAVSSIETDDLVIEPNWGRTRDDDCADDAFRYCVAKVRGYAVHNRFVVTLTQADKVDGVISKALEAGVNNIYSVDFQTTDLKKYREQARNLAIQAAKEKAQKLSQGLGQSIGSAIQVSEGRNYSGYDYRWWRQTDRFDDMSQNVMQNTSPSGSGEAGETEAVALGKIAVRAAVSVTFVLKPN